MGLTPKQQEILLRPIKPSRVAKTPQGMSHLESYDVIAHLIRLFGFVGWDSEVTGGPDLVFEDFVTWIKDGQTREGWNVVYRATVRLTIKDADGNVLCVKEDSATGDAQHQPGRADAHDLALKSAVSTAEKRAARKLGDQFGLSLYDKGSTEATVRTLVQDGEEHE